ncbi:phospho-N-acetylmuramoyl-pentapeptide-transferase homolog isoform X1 [Ipomoea triloba]|uniref:phospho-N-acetylmuramoyl-pentapeptide- transferase homolog isoform X1 n=1 Tax=Ipomoea triloba TaxID=35885 RepID=UPI00125D0565|nr:phospho-N-acetylmuramoyl-pentapeptide-transferase homolog isoform X1 [Ipomoea triloba]
MRSHTLSASNLDANFSRLCFSQSVKRSSLSKPSRFCVSFFQESFRVRSCFNLKIPRVNSQHCGLCCRSRLVPVRLMGEDFDFSPTDDWGESDGVIGYGISSSEGEESDGEIALQSVSDVDLPTTKEKSYPANDSITVTAHRLTMLGRTRRRRKIRHGILNNIGLVTFSTLLLFLVDCCAWKIVRLPLAPFFMMRPFLISAVAVSCIGYVCVPLFRTLRLRSLIRREGPAQHSAKKGTPTMGGLYFIPIGVLVADSILRFSSVEVLGASVATLAFATIGFLDDLVSLKNDNRGLSAWIRILLEVAVGIWFSLWLNTTDISSPYSMKAVVPLPAPLGLVCLGRFYPILTCFCFTSMANGVNLTDGLDGLAGGTAALAFIGMSIAVLPICPDVAIFGASIAGACVGFLMHNRYRASIFMGDTGSLAIGGALASMAAVTGMFFPLFIASGIFVVEALSVVLQVSFFKASRKLVGNGQRLFRMAPFHHHLELCGLREPVIVAGAYVVSCILGLYAGYVGLISV